MGEYASYGGQHIKIGTCEDMYYLRADQRGKVVPLSGNVDPARNLEHIRFRFPWPDEDGKAPGDFDDYNRGLAVWGVTVPEGVEHGSVQFKAPVGYLVSLPCPESVGTVNGNLQIHRNGFQGPVKIVQQRFWNGALVLVCACGGCGARYRLEELESAESIVVALRSQADKDLMPGGRGPSSSVYLHAVADRIVAGYGATL